MRKLLAKFSFSLNQISEKTLLFWQVAQTYNIILFSGEMGSGKTTFIHFLCKYLCVEDIVTSPTFSLINEYRFKGNDQQLKTIFHLDLYRINSITDAINAGIEDCILRAKSGNNYVFIEWPEKAIELVPVPYLFVKIETINELEREMELWEVNGK
jgi:tRNA threonylcarbamoyladenosine biosynthesis protein TsaE